MGQSDADLTQPDALDDLGFVGPVLEVEQVAGSLLGERAAQIALAGLVDAGQRPL